MGQLLNDFRLLFAAAVTKAKPLPFGLTARGKTNFPCIPFMPDCGINLYSLSAPFTPFACGVPVPFASRQKLLYRLPVMIKSGIEYYSPYRTAIVTKIIFTVTDFRASRFFG